jgi:predicted TIM-barrel fold metal-dependent hydrolase
VEGRHIPDLLPHLENAGPRLVIDHLGRPEPHQVKDAPGFRCIVDAVNRGKAWIKASCGYRIGPVAVEHFRGFLEECGPDRLFWASDCPFVGHEGELEYADTLRWLEELLDNDEDARLIFGENAKAFYFPEMD